MFNLNDLSIITAQERAADLVREAERERRLAMVDPPLPDPLVHRARAVPLWVAAWPARLVRRGGRRGLATPGCA